MHHMYYGSGTLGWIMSALHMIIPIIIIYLLVTFFTRKEPRVEVSYSDRSLELLKERYIKGEISREDFLRMKNDISG